MPFNPGGVFSLVASYFATAGSTIKTEQHNPPLEDIAAGMSQVLVRDGRAPMTGALNMNGFAITNVAPGTDTGNVATLAQAMPIGAIIDYAGLTAPTGWLLCYGQPISRATYAALFAIVGTTYGAGDGSTTFNLPDLCGRVTAGRDNMSGVAANRLTSLTVSPGGSTMGASGGEQRHTTTAQESASLTFSASTSVTVDPVSVGIAIGSGTGSSGSYPAAPGAFRTGTGNSDETTPVAHATTSVSSNAGGQPHNNVQPTFVLNKIIRVSYDG